MIELEDEVVESDIDGDVGCGRPGTFEWHKAKINEMGDKLEVAEYLLEATGKTVDKRLTLKKTKLAAIAMIGVAYD